MLLWGATYCVRYVKCDANDSLCTTCFAVTAGCGTAALAITAQIRTDTTQHVIHIKIYILAQLYHKRQQRLIYVHIPHKESNSSIISQFRVFNGLSTCHLMKTTLNGYKHDSSCSNLCGIKKVVEPSNFLPLWHKAPKKRRKEGRSTPTRHLPRCPSNKYHHLLQQSR